MIELNDLQAQYLSIKGEIDTAIEDVIYHSAFVGGYAVKRFEENFAAYVGAQYCVGVGNGTDALEIILTALAITESGVIMPAMTAAPTVEAVVRTGNFPIFCDVDANCTLDLDQVHSYLRGHNVGAILPVHLYGTAVDMPQLCALAEPYSIPIIEDCAQAHGTRWQGQHVGTFGAVGAFSFYPSKNLGAWGDGGAIVTNNEHVALRCRALANHGRLDKFGHELVGRNSRLDGLQAAILAVKLQHLDDWIARRREVAARYDEYFGGYIPQWNVARHSYHQYPVLVKERSRVQAILKERGVRTGLHYPFILPDLPPYRDYANGVYPNAQLLSTTELSLPVHEMLTNGEVDMVIAAVWMAIDESL